MAFSDFLKCIMILSPAITCFENRSKQLVGLLQSHFITLQSWIAFWVSSLRSSTARERIFLLLHILGVGLTQRTTYPGSLFSFSCRLCADISWRVAALPFVELWSARDAERLASTWYRDFYARQFIIFVAEVHWTALHAISTFVVLWAALVSNFYWSSYSKYAKNSTFFLFPPVNLYNMSFQPDGASFSFPTARLSILCGLHLCSLS